MRAARPGPGGAWRGSPSWHRAGRSQSGSAAAVVVVALAALVLPSLAVGLASSMALRHGVAEPGRELADRLAEAGAAEAYVVVSRWISPPSSPGYLCVASSPCLPSSPDYLGCYTYGPGRYGAVTLCPAPQRPPSVSGQVWVWALGIAATGQRSQVVFRVRSSGQPSAGVVDRWSALRR